MRLSIRSLRIPLRAGLAVAGLTSCLGSSNTVTGPPQTVAYLRIVQVVSDAGTGVNVSLGSSGAAGPIPFGSYIPGPGAYGPFVIVSPLPQLTFTEAGTPTPFYNQVGSTIVANGQFTAIALGRVAAGAVPTATVTVIADTGGVVPTGTLIRVFNAVDYVTASASGNPVDVYVYPQGTPRPEQPDVAALAWNARSAYLSRTPGNLQVDVFSAGAASSGTPLFSAKFMTDAASIRTLVLRDPPAGSVAGTTGAVIVLSDQN